MRATGIVRRIDDLGRVVIPKELRNTMRIRTTDPLEFYVNGNEIILKQYKRTGNIDALGETMAKGLYEVFSNPVIISDETEIVGVAGPQTKGMLKKKLRNFFPALENEETLVVNTNEETFMVQEKEVHIQGFLYVPALHENKVVGSIVMLATNEPITEATKKSLNIQKIMIEKAIAGVVSV